MRSFCYDAFRSAATLCNIFDGSESPPALIEVFGMFNSKTESQSHGFLIIFFGRSAHIRAH